MRPSCQIPRCKLPSWKRGLCILHFQNVPTAKSKAAEEKAAAEKAAVQTELQKRGLTSGGNS
jgi:hypothetical protein